MSLVPFGFWAASGGAPISYWLATLGETANDEANGIAFDSSNNLYTVGVTRSQGLGFRALVLVKYSSAGSVEWQRILSGSVSEYGYGVKVDSSNNVYAFGTTNSGGADNDFLLAKYNDSGTLQWQRTLGGSGNQIGRAVALDSSDNIYVMGDTDTGGAGSLDFLLAKYNSSGTIQWQRVLGGSGTEEGFSIAIDSSDNIYVLGYTDSVGAGSRDFLFAKYTTAGAIQWQRILGGSDLEIGRGITTDLDGNLYVTGQTRSAGAGGDEFIVAKYNSAGSIQWQRVLGGTGGDSAYGVSTDSDGNVYVAGFTDSTGEGSQDFLLAKYNLSGTIQWQRSLGGTGSDRGFAISVDSLGNLYAAGRTSSTGEGVDEILIAKLPNDGSLTGTYVLDGVNMVYAASTLTAATSSLTASTSSLTAATSSFTAATSSLTGATSTLISHFVDIPA